MNSRRLSNSKKSCACRIFSASAEVPTTATRLTRRSRSLRVSGSDVSRGGRIEPKVCCSVFVSSIIRYTDLTQCDKPMISNDTLSPGFLIASPRLDGSVFERTVIVMVQHDVEGAMGFIVNRPIEVDLGTLLEMVDVDQDQISKACYEETVFFGGPVRVEQLWVIEDQQSQFTPTSEDDIEFLPGWKVVTSAETIKHMALGAEKGTFRPYMGFAGWGPGQLEGEIADGSWLLLDFDAELVFSADLKNVWSQALERLGISETVFMLMGKAGEA
jgi:putative transcriptional regulator